MKRAAIVIGVNRTGGMTELQAAVKGATDFQAWALAQGCKSKLLVDGPTKKVTVEKIFDEVKKVVDAGTFDQLIVFFSGHGILSAPLAEFWLLSKAPENAVEAVNVPLSIDGARNSGIPHVVFVSDACRSEVKGLPLSGVTGGSIFPNRVYQPKRSQVDQYYGTSPGDPSYEASEKDAVSSYRGIFTECLLEVVKAPPADLVEMVQENGKSISVVSSRMLKPYLETNVPMKAADIKVTMRQIPELRVESALPTYFANVTGAPAPTAPPAAPMPRAIPHIDLAFRSQAAIHFPPPSGIQIDDEGLAAELEIPDDVEKLAQARGRGHYETTTGFSVFGAKPERAWSSSWSIDSPFTEDGERSWNLRLNPTGYAAGLPTSILIDLGAGFGTLLAVMPGFIGTVVVEGSRVTAVNYIPSDQTERYQDYLPRAEELEHMKAFAAVAARHGRFEVPSDEGVEFADYIRQGKGFDPTLGLYAAYAYHQVGQDAKVQSVFEYMKMDDRLPVPFDVAMLAGRSRPLDPDGRYAPFAPMLSQGWALLSELDALYRPIHTRLRPHLVPSLWTTLSAEGITLAALAIESGEVR